MLSGKEIRIIALLVIDITFFLLEAIVGYAVHSLALIADSFHMLNDIISLFIALWAVRVKNTKPADGKYTYGWQRAEILGALVNSVFLLALCFTIIIEAIQRFFEPQNIQLPKLVLIVGTAGLISNIVGLVLFHEHGHSHSHGGGGGGDSHGHGHSHGHSHSHSEDEEQALVTDIEQEENATNSQVPSNGLTDNSNESSNDITQYFPVSVVQRLSNVEETSPLLNKNSTSKLHTKTKKKSMNMEGVFLHVLGDALGNVGVILTGFFIWKTDYSWRFYADPLVSLVITIIIFNSALPLCLRASKILLQAAPTNVDSNSILAEIVRLENVKSVHDFHVWTLNEDILIASLHLEMNGEGLDQDPKCISKKDFTKVVTDVREILHEFGIHSATIQPEFEVKNTLPRKPSAYGSTQAVCHVDDATGCDNDVCK